MQIILNQLIALNVKDPVVYGLLIQGNKYSIAKLTLYD